MNNHSLIITYAGDAAAVEDGYWLRLDQDPIRDDVATATDAANLINTVFDIDPCVDDADAIYSKVESVQEAIDAGTLDVDDTLQSAASAVLDLAVCDQEADGSVEVEIKVIRSHPNEPYVLRVSGGEVVRTVIVSEEVSQAPTVDQASTATLDFPVVDGFSVSWSGNAVAANGLPLPEIQRTGSTLWWSGKVTGTIHAVYQSRWEVATIRVAGVDGEQGEALVRCFFHGLVDELTPELPSPAEDDKSLCSGGRIRGELPEGNAEVTCYQTVYVARKCSCSQEEIGHTTHEEVVPCPEGAPTKCPGVMETCMHNLGTVTATEYVACTSDGDETLRDPDYYRARCCVDPRVSLPRCREEHRIWRGGAPLENGLDYWRAMYGKNLRVVPVSPPGGICGEWIIRQNITSKNCCDMATPLSWGSVGDMVLPPQNQYLLRINGGIGPYTWRSSNPELEILSLTEDTAGALIFGGPDFCGTAMVTVTDACGQVATMPVRSTVGGWVNIAWPDSYVLPDGFDPGPADAPGPTDLCGAFTMPTVRTSGKWRVNIAFGSVGLVPGACPAVPGDVGAITLLTGLGMHPYQAMCLRNNCPSSSGWGLATSSCCSHGASGVYMAYYQRINTVEEWQC